MRVSELWRYPVKSLQGERLDLVEVTSDGLEGDRRFAIYDVETGLGLTARRVPELLFGSARLQDGSSVEITLPDGSTARDDDALSAWLGRPVALRSASDDVTRRYENPVDFEHDRSTGTVAVLAPAVALYSLAMTRGRTQQLLAAAASITAVIVADAVHSGRPTVL